MLPLYSLKRTYAEILAQSFVRYSFRTVNKRGRRKGGGQDDHDETDVEEKEEGKEVKKKQEEEEKRSRITMEKEGGEIEGETEEGRGLK